MTDPAVDALKRLLQQEAPEASLAEACKLVAKRIHANWRAVHHIVTDTKLPSGRPRGVGRDLREKLERHFPGWMALPHSGNIAGEPRASYRDTGQRNTPELAGKSQPLRPLAQKMAPPKIGWEALMQGELPPEFETVLPDNAMAPEAPRGSRVIMVTGVTPEPGDWVLIADRTGNVHFREYRVDGGQGWQAHALNRAFLPLHSSDGLRVLAVFDGLRGRRSAR